MPLDVKNEGINAFHRSLFLFTSLDGDQAKGVDRHLVKCSLTPPMVEHLGHDVGHSKKAVLDQLE